jgi:hypothetical protein
VIPRVRELLAAPPEAEERMAVGIGS